MSIPNLPVDFKDDILNTGVNQKRKYQQMYNSDGSVSFEDVTAYQQKGSDFGAQQVNETNGAVNNIYAERIVDLDELDLVTEPGFFVDALAVKELNSNMTNLLLIKSKSTRINVTAGQSTYSYIILDVVPGYTPVISTVWSSHITTKTSDAHITDDRVTFSFAATAPNTPETFTANTLYVKTLAM